MKVIGILVLLWSVVSNAGAQSDRDNVMGSWVQRGESEGGPASLWTFRADGNMMYVTHTESGKKIADFQCDTKGAGCDVKIDGKKAMVSMWFDGSKLMELEFKDSDVLERSFAFLPQGDEMEVKLIPVVPTGKAETVQYKRVPLSAQGKH